MTFDELVRKVAQKNGMVIKLKGRKGRPDRDQLQMSKVSDIIRDALNIAADAAKEDTAPLFPALGRFVMKATRSTGRKPDGTVWTRPGRQKLGFTASIHRGAENRTTKPKTTITTAPTAPESSAA